MNFGRVIGTCVLNKTLPSLEGITLRLVQTTDEKGNDSGSILVAADTVGAKTGDSICYVTSAEAAKALEDPFNPASAAITAIIDHLPKAKK